MTWTIVLLQVNPVRAKELTNIRSAGKDENVKLTPPRLVCNLQPPNFCLYICVCVFTSRRTVNRCCIAIIFTLDNLKKPIVVYKNIYFTAYVSLLSKIPPDVKKLTKKNQFYPLWFHLQFMSIKGIFVISYAFRGYFEIYFIVK